jgi:L-seryl-tRNA(Ser) seleniumtransferase
MVLQNRGLGRLMKAGKEAIVGALAARCVGDARSRGRGCAEGRMSDRALQAASLSLARHGDWTGNPVVRAEIRLDPERAGLHAWELAERCLAGTPAVALRDDLSMHQLLYLDPCNVTAAEAEIVAERIRAVCSSARAGGDGLKRDWVAEKRARGRAPTPWLDGTSDG